MTYPKLDGSDDSVHLNPPSVKRQGVEVQFEPSPASMLLYRDPPAIGTRGFVAPVAGALGMRGPGGGLIYVDWDDGRVMGVSPQDLRYIGPGTSGFRLVWSTWKDGTKDVVLYDRAGHSVNLIHTGEKYLTRAQEMAFEQQLMKGWRAEVRSTKKNPSVDAAESPGGTIWARPATGRRRNAPSDKRGLPSGLKDLFRNQTRAFVSGLKNRIDAIENDPVVDRHGHVDELLADANKALGWYGVEAIRVEGAQVDRYYRDIIGLYVNNGDTYKPTLIYDTAENRFAVGGWGDFLEAKELEEAREQAGEMARYRDRVIDAMARTLWLQAYADWAESDEAPEDAARPGSGEDWDDYAPETPIAAQQAAATALRSIEKLNKKGIHDILLTAILADRDNGKREPRDVGAYAESLGSDLAMMLTGSGASWFDNHAKFRLIVPHGEANSWNGTDFEGSFSERLARDAS